MAKIEDLLAHLGPLAPEFARQRLQSGSYACLRRKYLFLHTPKAACSTMKWVLASLHGGPKVVKQPMPWQSTLEMAIHYRTLHPVQSLLDFPLEQAIHLLTSDEIVRFCAVRNPYARFVSAWADKIRQMEPEFFQLYREILKRNGIDAPTYDDAPTFAQFVDYVVATDDPRSCNQHWRTMASLVLIDSIKYTHIVKLETLLADLTVVFAAIAPEADARQLLAENRAHESLPVNWKSLYDDDLAEKVWRFCAEDFETFGYDKESWRAGAGEREVFRDTALEQAALRAIRARNHTILELYAAQGRAASG